MVGDKVRLPPVLFQPMAADDVASAVGRIAVGPPVNGTVEIAGPEQFRLDELVRERLAALKDTREIIADPEARYAGARVSLRTLMPDQTGEIPRVPGEGQRRSGAGARQLKPQTALLFEPLILIDRGIRYDLEPQAASRDHRRWRIRRIVRGPRTRRCTCSSNHSRQTQLPSVPAKALSGCNGLAFGR